MTKDYACGRAVVIAMHRSKHGMDRKTAFATFAVSTDRLKEWQVEVKLDGDRA